MRERIRRLLECSNGGALVEFAVVAGLILTPLLLGIMEFGFASWARNTVVSDAREGARYAIVRGSTSANVATVDSVRRFVRSKTGLPTSGPDSIRVYAAWPTGNAPGSFVEVSVAHRVARRGPFLAAHTDSASSKMVIRF